MFKSKNLRAWLLGGASAVAVMGLASNANAQTAAGTVITNQATATFQDASGNEYTAVSNVASVTVQQVYTATLGSDRFATSQDNRGFASSHILTNTGNGEDTYTLSLSNVGGDDGDLSDFRIYRDMDNDGIYDADDTAPGPITSVTLNANESTTLFIRGTLPDGLNHGDVLQMVLNATGSDGVVTDLTAAGGVDGADGTNHATITIQGDAELQVTKTSVHDEANRQITYTVTAENVGQSPAIKASIYDWIPANTTYVDGSAVDGVYADEMTESATGKYFNDDGDRADNTEAELGIDADGDGTVGTNVVAGVYRVYSEGNVLNPGSSMSFTYTVSYDASVAAGTVIANTAYTKANLDGQGSGADEREPFVVSNTTNDTVPFFYGVVVSDTGTGAANGVNDGGDDDGTINDNQIVVDAIAGESVKFLFDVTNESNTATAFNLSVINGTNGNKVFPAGTTFEIQDLSGNAITQTSSIAMGATQRVQVIANLPLNAPEILITDNATNVNLYLKAETSDGSVSNRAKGTVDSMRPATVDIANGPADNDPNVNQHQLTDGSPIMTLSGNPGDTVSFPITVQNDAGAEDTFEVIATIGWGNAVPVWFDGWAGNVTDTNGNVVTQVTIPAGGSVELIGNVTIPTDYQLALADYTSVAGENNTNPDTPGANYYYDQNGDGDGDYIVGFVARSLVSDAFDHKHDGVDVNDVEAITLTPENQSQSKEPGQIATYVHQIKNEGNTTETLVDFPILDNGQTWGQLLTFDSDGDGFPDRALYNIPADTPLYYKDADGNTISQPVTGGSYSLVLKPGESMPMGLAITIANDASRGESETATWRVDYTDGNTTVAAVTTTVILGDLELVKTASVDASCTDAAAIDLGPDVAFAESVNEAAPGDCIVWQVVVSNIGDAPANDVNVRNPLPEFTQHEAGTLRMCVGDAGLATTPSCSFVTRTDASDGDEMVFGNDTYHVQLELGGLGGAFPSGTMQPGDVFTYRYATRVE